jgi:hypothetical protein
MKETTMLSNEARNTPKWLALGHYKTRNARSWRQTLGDTLISAQVAQNSLLKGEKREVPKIKAIMDNNPQYGSQQTRP